MNNNNNNNNGMYSNISRVTNNDNQLIMVFTVQRVEAGATLRFCFPISNSKHSMDKYEV